jgi:energy-coupling factor transport system ATP-binding protein
MVRLENITYRYAGDFPPALLNINLELAAGERCCIMGGNGSGKSTLAKLCAGLLKTQQGRISLSAGKDIQIPVGILFQDPDNQSVAVTVEKEIVFALENLGVSQLEMEKKVDQILRNLSIEHLRDRLTAELSVGEKQRIALASLFVFNPQLLILDEPDSFLDARGKKLFRKQLEIVKSKKPDLTIMEITQYPEVARNYERLIVLHDGRVVADGAPLEILDNEQLCIRYGVGYSRSDVNEMEFPLYLNEMQNKRTKWVHRVEFSRVSFMYPNSGSQVLKNFTAQLNCGEITAVVGPSGSGKSTLGMLLCGILRPSSGNIKYSDGNGREIEMDKLQGRVTGCLQQPERQFFLHTCQEEIEFGPRNFSQKMSRKTIQALFEMSGLHFEEFVNRDPFTLSLGEKRRLAFASILSLLPDFIVFDEPTCALDCEGVGRFISMASALKKSGLGVIIISHHEEVVRALADKIIAFDGIGNFWSVGAEEYFSSKIPEASTSTN